MSDALQPTGNEAGPLSEPPTVEASVRSAVERAITAALSRKGIGGTVVVRDRLAELHGVGDGVVAIDLGDWVSQWNLLPPEMCDRRAETAALRLANALGRPQPSGADRRAARARVMKTLFYALAVVVVGAGVGWFWDKGFFGRGPSEPAPEAQSAAPVPAHETSAQAAARTARACEAARQRLYAGAAMGVDVAGWVVELWLAGKAGSAPLHQHARLGALGAEGAAKELGAQGPGAIAIAASEAPELGALSAALIRLEGGYTASFFTHDGRERFIAFADRLAGEVGATHAALFARCAHLTTRDVGAWYRGPDAGAATATVLYAAGGFVEPPAFDRSRLGGDGDALALLAAALGKVEGGKVDEALRQSGGRVEGPKAGASGATTIRFPLGGPTRATLVSRDLSRLAAL